VALVEACDGLAETHGVRFLPSPWLRALRSRGEGLNPYRGREQSA
jgi:hypothetical protein